MSPYDFLRSQILPLDQIDQAIPQGGKIVDLGCGEGVISKYIAKNRQRTVIGVDFDTKRLPKSNLKNLQFVSADIRRYVVGRVDGVIISDVLHHLKILDQKRLVVRISKSLNRGGILIIKEIDTKEKVRSLLSRFWDFVLYPKDKISYWDSDDLRVFLNKLGFKVKIFRPSRFFPGSTTLFICKK